MLPYFLAYGAIGIVACLLHPGIRGALASVAAHKPKSSEVILKPVLAAGLFVFAVAIWPISIIRCKSTKTPTLLDVVQAASSRLIVTAYRNIAAQTGCAPTAKTSDREIIEIYSNVTAAFQEAAKRRGELIPATFLNAIVMKFLQVHEQMGHRMFTEHLRYELEKYSTEGLREDYKRELKLF